MDNSSKSMLAVGGCSAIIGFAVGYELGRMSVEGKDHHGTHKHGHVTAGGMLSALSETNKMTKVMEELVFLFTLLRSAQVDNEKSSGSLSTAELAAGLKLIGAKLSKYTKSTFDISDNLQIIFGATTATVTANLTRATVQLTSRIMSATSSTPNASVALSKLGTNFSQALATEMDSPTSDNQTITTEAWKKLSYSLSLHIAEFYTSAK